MRGRNALQAILAGISGGLEGQASQRAFEDERRRLEQDRLDRLAREAAASERQALMDQVALTEKGYVEQGARADTVKRATPALQDALTNVTSAMRGQAPTRQVDMGAIMNAAGQYGAPVSSVEVGGKTLELAQTPIQRAAMLAEQERGAARDEAQREREAASRQKQSDTNEMARRIKSALGDKVTDAQALAMASGVGADYFITKPMSEEDRERLAIARGQLDVDRGRLALSRAELGQTGGAGVKLPAAAQAKLAGYESGLSMTASLRQMMDANKDATGLKGLMWGPALDRLDPEGVGVRSAMEALSGEIRNQRFGGALTASEAKFAERFLPSDKDNYQTALTKLDGLERYLQQKTEGLFKAAQFGKNGWQPSPEERVEPRKPGETVAQYRARTGGTN